MGVDKTGNNPILTRLLDLNTNKPVNSTPTKQSVPASLEQLLAPFKNDSNNMTPIKKGNAAANFSFDNPPVNSSLETNNISGASFSKDNVLKSLAEKCFSRGQLVSPKLLETEVLKLLKDPKSREGFIDAFGLKGNKNMADLMAAMSLEAGYDQKINTFPVGAVILNRTLAINITKSAAFYSKNNTSKGYNPVSVSQIINEPGQFAISKARFRSESAAYIKNPNIQRFETNHKVIQELLGTNGEAKTTFTMGKKTINTSDLFYFHKASFPQQKLATPNGHTFATYFARAKTPYFTDNYTLSHFRK